jgi:metal-responsive CopG/Arc/MetJ family transcriptional regulator
MNYAQVVETCCRDLRRYLESALKTTRGGVVSVKMRRLLRAELPWSDRMRYATCLSRILRPWRWGDAYVIPRQDATRLLETFDSLCESVKNVKRRRESPKQRETSQSRQPKEELVFIAVSLPNDLVRALDEYARLHNMSRSAVIRRAVQELLDMRRVLEELSSARSRPLKIVTLRLPTDLLNALNEYSAALKAPRSALIRYAIHKLIEKIKTETAP